MAQSRARSGPGDPGSPPGAGAPPAGGAAASGTHQSWIAQLRAVLRQYISSVLLDSVIQSALERNQAQAHKGPALYEAITADCMIGLRMFVSDEDLPELMLALCDFLEQLPPDDTQPRRSVFAKAADGVATIDARGRSCPLPIVFASRAMRDLRLGDRLRVLADDRAFVADIRNWAKRRHHVFVGLETKASYFEALIQKSG
jgi:tRNA 2-thiouridine synthesizing protein A